MDSEFIKNLSLNASLLLTLSLIYNSLFFRHWESKKIFHILMGLMIGFVGILLMINSVTVSSGIIFDTRSILISTTGMFFGIIPTAIASAVIIGFRIYVGGSGVLTGILVTVCTAGIGLLCHKINLTGFVMRKKHGWTAFYGFGMVTHLVMLACMAALPRESVVTTLKQITIPILLVYPVASQLLCMVIFTTFKNVQTKLDLEKSEENYKNLFHDYQSRQMLLISLLNSIPDFIFYKDNEGRYIGCNEAFERFAGKPKEKIVGFTDFDLFDKEMATLFTEMDKAMMEQKKQRKNEETVFYPNGEKACLETLKTPYYDPQGNVVGVIGISRDISERKKREEEILYLNYHDVLTGLYNRAYLEEQKVWYDRNSMLPLSVMIGDINGLKIINDAFGHAQGDHLLVTIAGILVRCCRPGDVIARIGGDEFCILLPNTTPEAAKSVFDKIKDTCEDYNLNANANASTEVSYISISLGLATKTKPEESLDEIIKSAEDFMYRRKLLESRSLHSSIISSIRMTLFEKSNETEQHAERLAYLSKKLGQALGLDEEELVELELVSTLHDIGKISIDRNVLTKPGPLTEAEWIEVKKHPEAGYRIAQTVPELRRIAEYILCHHERWDGKGYPQELSGNSIPLLSRIIAIVDSYDAMTEDRTYRKAISKEMAVAELVRNSGTQFDPDMVRIFTEQILNRDY